MARVKMDVVIFTKIRECLLNQNHCNC